MEAGSLQIGDTWIQAGDFNADGYAGLPNLGSGDGRLDLERAPPLSGATAQAFFNDDPEASEDGTWAVLSGPTAGLAPDSQST